MDEARILSFPYLTSPGPAAMPLGLFAAGRPVFRIEPRVDRASVATAPPIDLYLTGRDPAALAAAALEPAVVIVAHAADAAARPTGKWLDIARAGDRPPQGLPFGSGRVAVVAADLARWADVAALMAIGDRCRSHYLRTLAVVGGDAALLDEALDQRAERGGSSPFDAVVHAPTPWPALDDTARAARIAQAATFLHRLAEARAQDQPIRWYEIGRLIGRCGMARHDAGGSAKDLAPQAVLVTGPAGAPAAEIERVMVAALGAAPGAGVACGFRPVWSPRRQWIVESLASAQGRDDVRPASQTPTSTSAPPA